MISKAPDDPDEKKKWAHQMMRIQVAMYIDDKSCCAACGHVYTSVDDFLRCSPKAGGRHKDNSFVFVDSACWEEWSKNHDKS